MRRLNCAVVGATGMVGRMIIQLLSERKTPVGLLRLFASARSAGKIIEFNGEAIEIEELTNGSFDGSVDAALFGLDEETSRKYAPLAVQSGAVVIDNSPAYRMDPTVPLVVPEVNSADIAGHSGIIANPNCCAIPAVVALNPLHREYGIERIVYSTYQSVSGAGVAGVDDLTGTLAGKAPKFFPGPIAHNIIPHIGSFDDDGYTGEELKLIAETKKILGDCEIKATATTVRVPVFYGHCLSINVSLNREFDIRDVKTLLSQAPGLKLTDAGDAGQYPTPLSAAGTDLVYAGRIRRDTSLKNGLNMWVAADNVRKGAATNAVQILEEVFGC